MTKGSSLVEALERLSSARDSQQFKQMLAGYYTVNRTRPSAIKKLRLIEEIWIIGKKRR